MLYIFISNLFYFFFLYPPKNLTEPQNVYHVVNKWSTKLYHLHQRRNTDEFVVETVVSSSEFMVDDTSARNFNDKSFGSSVVLKSPIELHNAYTAAIVLALVIFFVALYVSIFKYF